MDFGSGVGSDSPSSGQPHVKSWPLSLQTRVSCRSGTTSRAAVRFLRSCPRRGLLTPSRWSPVVKIVGFCVNVLLSEEPWAGMHNTSFQKKKNIFSFSTKKVIYNRAGSRSRAFWSVVIPTNQSFRGKIKKNLPPPCLLLLWMVFLSLLLLHLP